MPRPVLALSCALGLLCACSLQSQVAPAHRGDASRFRYDRQAALDVRDSLERVERGMEVRRVSFASPKGGRATGYLLVPPASAAARDGRFAGALVMHGAPGTAATVLPRALRLAQLGVVTFALDAPFARRDPRQALTFTTQDRDESVQLVVELQRAVDLLLSRRDVDPSRLGFIGGSYGGGTGALLAGVERRLKAYALAVADGGPSARFIRPDGSFAPPPEGVTPERWRAWVTALDEISAERFVGNAAPARLLFQWGKEDPLVTRELADRLYRAASEPKEARWYDSGHALPLDATNDATDWLATQLGARTLTPEERAVPLPTGPRPGQPRDPGHHDPARRGPPA